MTGPIESVTADPREPEAPLIRYRGINRRGQSVCGAASESDSPAALTERLYRQRFRSATVTRGEFEVGGVTRGIWWAEST